MPKALGDQFAACIYVISPPSGQEKLSKVGFSIWPHVRCKQLEAKFKLSLKVHYAILVPHTEAITIERIVHEELKPFALGKEWFRIIPEFAAEYVRIAVGQFENGYRVPKKQRGHRFIVPATEELLQRVEEWRAKQRPIPNKSEAARMLIERALEAEEKRRG